MAIAKDDGSIILSTKVDTSGLNKGMSQIEGKTSSLTKAFSKLGAVMGAAFAVQKLVQFGQEAINLASDLQEVQNVVDTAFGGMAYKIEDFSKTAIEQFGLSELAAKRWSSTMMAMGSGMGQSMEIGSDMAVELTGRLADVMSFYNKTEEEAFTLGKAIYSGETEPLKSIGIIMTENNLALFAMSKGYQQAYKDMDAANKLLVRQQYFLEKTSLAAGDYTKTADGWANQTRTLSQRWKEMQVVFGETFIALGVLVLPIIQTVIDGLKQIALMLKNLSIMFGIVKQETEDTNNNTQEQAKNTEQITENIEEQADAQKEFNKELKKTRAGFDEIQILSAGMAENADDKLGAAIQGAGDESGVLGQGASDLLPTGTGVVLDGSPIVEEVSQTFVEIAGEISGWLMALGCILLVTGNIGWGVGLIIAGALAQEYSEAQIGDGSSLQEFMDTLTNALIIGGLVAILIGLLLCVAQMWGIGIKLIVIGVAAVAVPIAINWNSIEEKLQGEFGRNLAIVGVIAIILGILVCIAGAIPVGIGLIVLGAGAVVTPVVVNWDTITNTISSVFMRLSENIWAGLGMVVLGIILCCTGVGVGLGLALILTGASSMITAVAVNWDAIVDWVRGAWTAVSDFFEKHIAPVLTKEFWLSLAVKCGNGLIGGFEGAINAILQMFETMINRISEHLNAISIDIPDWVLGIGGKSFGFDIPTVSLGRISIPRLAQGTVVPPNKRFMAMLGDNTVEHEIVSPVSKMKQAFIEAMTEMGGVGQTSREEHYYLNETELMRVIYSLVKGGQHLDGDTLVEE